MIGFNELKSLRDIGTAKSRRSRSASRHKGTPYLEILSLGMGKLRLETELARLAKRQQLIENQLDEIRRIMAKRLSAVQEEAPSVPDAPAVGANEKQTPERRPSGPRNWSTMTLEY